MSATGAHDFDNVDLVLNEPMMDDMMNDLLNSSIKEPAMTNEQLCSKINAFRHMCSANKINSNNAFDLHMTEYFHKWLKKKSNEGKLNHENLFQDMSDYLDATGKIYSCRIDSVNSSIKSLYEKVRMDGLIKNHKNYLLDDAIPNEQPEIKHNKRTRAMITTSDKLRGNPIESNTQLETPFDLMELTKAGRPSEYFLSRFNNTTFAEQFKRDLEKSKKVVKNSDKFTMKNKSKQIKAGEICPEFSGFMAERHTQSCDNNLNLDYVEDRYDPDNIPSKNCTISNETSLDFDNRDQLGSSLTREERVEQFKGLVNCIDHVKSDYSYFNPTLLVKWCGPKAWKAQTLKKSLRSQSEHSKIPVSSPEDFDDHNDDDDESKQIKVKPSKNQRKVIENKVLVDWIHTKEINYRCNKALLGQEQVLPQTLDKWHPLNNAADPPPFKIKHKFKYLEFFEIKPNWLISPTNKEKGKSEKENIPENVLLDDYQDTDEYNENQDHFQNESAHIEVVNISQKSNDDEDILPKETKLDVTELKTEIMNIINQECVELLANNGKSTGISFYKLLQKINAFEREISMALIYVAILHLNNEKRLKILSADGDGDMAKAIIARCKKP